MRERLWGRDRIASKPNGVSVLLSAVWYFLFLTATNNTFTPCCNYLRDDIRRTEGCKQAVCTGYCLSGRFIATSSIRGRIHGAEYSICVIFEVESKAELLKSICIDSDHSCSCDDGTCTRVEEFLQARKNLETR